MALTDNLVAYWQLDEASGARNDSVGANNLTDNNTVTSAAGIVGSAAHFVSGNSEYLSLASNANVSFGNEDFTISCWVKLSDKATNYCAIGKGQVADEYGLFYIASSDRFRWDDPSSSTLLNNLGSPTAGVWYHLVVGYDSTNDEWFAYGNNGTKNSRGSSVGGTPNASNPFLIGAFRTTTGYLSGDVDEVGIWKRVLTAAERTQLFNGGAGLAYPFTGGGGGGIIAQPYYALLLGGIGGPF